MRQDAEEITPSSTEDFMSCDRGGDCLVSMDERPSERYFGGVKANSKFC